jgi:hypothetical protein
MAKQSPKRRLIVTYSDRAAADSNQICQKLESKGFECLTRLNNLNCVLGEFAGDPEDLKSVSGVVAVEVEDTMYSQE